MDPNEEVANSFPTTYPPCPQVLTLKPSSPGFSGSKSYRATAVGVWSMGERAGLFIGEGNGEAAEGREKEQEWDKYLCCGDFIEAYGTWWLVGRSMRRAALAYKKEGLSYLTLSVHKCGKACLSYKKPGSTNQGEGLLLGWREQGLRHAG